MKILQERKRDIYVKVSSKLQIGLSLMWTGARTRDISLSDVSKLLSSQPARLCGLEDRKGDLSVGMDADFVIWDPEESIKVRFCCTLC